MEYLFAEDENLVYALALVKRETLKNIYVDKVSLILMRLINNYQTAGTYFTLLDEKDIKSIEDVIKLERSFNTILESIQKTNASDIDEAAEILAAMLLNTDLKGSYTRFSPLSFQNTSFSSEFGIYFINKLQNLLSIGGTGGDNIIVLTGNYWEENKNLLIQVQAADGKNKSASAYVRVPADRIPGNIGIKPQNYDEHNSIEPPLFLFISFLPCFL